MRHRLPDSEISPGENCSGTASTDNRTSLHEGSLRAEGGADEKTDPAAALHRQLQAAKNAGVHPLEPAERDAHAPRLQRLLERPECFLAGDFFLRNHCGRAGRFARPH